MWDWKFLFRANLIYFYFSISINPLEPNSPEMYAQQQYNSNPLVRISLVNSEYVDKQSTDFRHHTAYRRLMASHLLAFPFSLMWNWRSWRFTTFSERFFNHLHLYLAVRLDSKREPTTFTWHRSKQQTLPCIEIFATSPSLNTWSKFSCAFVSWKRLVNKRIIFHQMFSWRSTERCVLCRWVLMFRCYLMCWAKIFMMVLESHCYKQTWSWAKTTATSC